MYFSFFFFRTFLTNISFFQREVDQEDRFWKVRMLFDEINRTAKELITQSKTVSVDEGMIKYFGPHFLKQRIIGKPVRYGFKVWILATADGQLLRCEPYAGATTHIQDFGLGQGPNVVMALSTDYNLLPGTRVYCDNLFTSLDLLDNMGDRSWGVTGTVRQIRLHDIPLPSRKEASKDMQRGDVEVVYSQDLMILAWKDNQTVYMASNCDGLTPMQECQRYSQKDKKYVTVPQPLTVRRYNASMGGVDVLDNGVKNYAIHTR